MFLKFPKDFLWGTSTAAAQIETASEHEWKGVVAKDGYIFDRTSDHELRRGEDLEYIARLGNAYRMGVDWARLQTEPFADFDMNVVNEYRAFLAKLKARGVYVMFVMHHFTNPIWFAEMGNWTERKSVEVFLNYAQQIVRHFGDLVDNWNTFNEPGVYLTNGYLLGQFPPFRKNYFAMKKALKHMSWAHRGAVLLIKESYPDAPVGISKNCVKFVPQNIFGRFPAWFMDRLFMETVADHFSEGVDYWGMSYYAKIRFDPFPITYIDTPKKVEKLGLRHDMMWEYEPKGMQESMMRYYERYKLPIIITESGIATDDCAVRIDSIKDYLGLIHEAMESGVPVQGYFHWSTMDNFEWNLGRTYRFGLVNVNFETGDRKMKESGEFYEQVVKEGGIDVSRAPAPKTNNGGGELA